MNAYRMDGYTGNIRARRNPSVGTMLLRVLRATLAVIAERLHRDTLHAALVGLLFLLALGVVGGMEAGTVSLYVGLPVCLAAALIGFAVKIRD